MNEAELKHFLKNIGKEPLNFERMLHFLKVVKARYVQQNMQAEAKQIWIREQIINIHEAFCNVFVLLQSKEYYPAWCQLEQIELTFQFLKRHYSVSNVYNLNFLEKAVANLQRLFPYRLFASSEMVKKEKKCSICQQRVNIRKPCGHEVGEIYNGEMCVREVTEVDLIAISLVENPANKYAVVFFVDPNTGNTIDEYNYELLERYCELIKYPYQYWDLELTEVRLPHKDYEQYSANQNCPCGSKLLYENCCLKETGVKGLHYEFILLEKDMKNVN
jgi:hypothetical protein